jgi:nucleotide-binding universal stress UspA family protein
MLTRIMVPTDGSRACAAAVDTAIGVAHAGGAQIVGLHGVPLRALMSRVAGGLAAPGNQALAQEYPGYVERRAQQAGVRATVLTTTSDTPYEAIIKAARALQCDLIVMGSRGRSGVKALLLGSQTQAVLTHGAIPALVIPQAAVSTG